MTETFPLFSDTPWSVDDVAPLAAALPLDDAAPRFVTDPHPVFVILIRIGDAGAVESTLKHVAWGTVVSDGNEALALLAATANAMGRLETASVAVGDLPKSFAAALTAAEMDGLLREDDQYGIVQMPQSKLVAVWLPTHQLVIPIGADLHQKIRKGNRYSQPEILGLLAEVWQSRRRARARTDRR